MTYIYHYQSPLGGITTSSNGNEIMGLWFDGQKYFGDTLTKNYEEKDLPIFEETKEWLDIYFSGKAPDFTPPLKMDTTPFRKAVWEIMLTIPFGQTMTLQTESQSKRDLQKCLHRRWVAQWDIILFL